MPDQPLATYLNDHLAGSEVALELLEHLEQARGDSPLASFAAGLRADIAADRRDLERLMGRLGIAVSRTRAAAGWLAEKGTRLKLHFDDPAAGPLHLLEIFDVVSIGIEGKRLLWRALAAAVETNPELAALDYPRLQQRAEEQRSRMESNRLQAAKDAFARLPAASQASS